MAHVEMIQAMPKIVVSYRRSDSSAMAGRIFDRLVARYGRESVFLDIENIPFGVDFRKHIQTTFQKADILLVIIGLQWMGAAPRGTFRIVEAADPVRIEVETALGRAMPIIPILIDGAKMPPAAELPESLHDFAFLNAIEITTGRDFHIHVDRLIDAIDQMLSTQPDAPVPGTVSSATTSRRPVAPDDTVDSAPLIYATSWSACLLPYLGFPIVVLLVAHHLIVNSFNLDTGYLRAVSLIVPSCFGFLLFWRDGAGSRTAVVLGIALGLVAVAGMAISESLNAGDPILPTTSYEWRENAEYAVSISLCFIVAYMFARGLYQHWVKKRKSFVGR